MRFAKYHGAGNDFILVDGDGPERDWSALALAICERNLGAGADGLIVALPSTNDAHVHMRLFNADGSEAEMSGNGVRCFAKYVVDNGLAKPDGDHLRVDTGAGEIVVQLQRRGDEVKGATVDMGPPRFAPDEVPVAVERPAPLLDLPVTVDGRDYAVACVSMGNPHAVHFVQTPPAEFPLREVGPKVEHHALFPARVNFEVAQVIDRSHIVSRTWERGVGETQACGTGASAIMVSARLHGWVDDRVEVNEPGGVLTLRWDGIGNVFLTGPAAFVYSGDWPD
ncbi:MAG TPA: diaminopimelate epimerase [Dehalococcoidia bacterium]|nr:diaminopimelate epimerase [Dehalococcoidia bacterium]